MHVVCEDPGPPRRSGPAMAVTITLKTLQQQTFKIRMEPEETVKVLKEKIEAEKGRDAFPVAGQKLIYAGKILSDDVPIRDYRIDEKNFVVVMVTKAKAGQGSSAPPEASPTAAPESSATSPAAPASGMSHPHRPPERTKAHRRSRRPRHPRSLCPALFLLQVAAGERKMRPPR